MRKLFIATCIVLILLLTACDQSTVPAETATQPATVSIPSATTAATEITAAVETAVATETQVNASDTPASTSSTASIAACPPETLPITGWPYYCDDSNGYFFQYPADSTQAATDTGAIHFDLTVLPDTNLGEKYVDITVQEGSETCSSPIAADYAPEMIETEELTINGLDFLKQSGHDAGAGNYYDWIAYSTGMNGKCVSFGFVLHSTNRYNYPTPPAEFDLTAETEVITQMINSFRWVIP